jgi:hypothetical protein
MRRRKRGVKMAQIATNEEEEKERIKYERQKKIRQ